MTRPNAAAAANKSTQRRWRR